MLTPAQIKAAYFELRQNCFQFVFVCACFLFVCLFFTLWGCAPCLRACFDAMLLPQSSQYPNPSEGADSICGQMPGDKGCLMSGVTNSGRVWRKAPESDARSVPSPHTSSLAFRHPSSKLCRNFDDTEGPLLVFSHLFTENCPFESHAVGNLRKICEKC